MDLEEVARLVSDLTKAPAVLAEFSHPEITVESDSQFVRAAFGEGLVIDLLPVGDWSECMLLCGSFSFERISPESAVLGIGEIISGRAVIRASGRWIFREATLRFTVNGEEWSETRPLSGELAPWEELLRKP